MRAAFVEKHTTPAQDKMPAHPQTGSLVLEQQHTAECLHACLLACLPACMPACLHACLRAFTS